MPILENIKILESAAKLSDELYFKDFAPPIIDGGKQTPIYPGIQQTIIPKHRDLWFRNRYGNLL